MIFPRREPHCSAPTSPAEALLLDRYLLSRNRYKEELIDSLAESASSGPALEVNGGFGYIGVELLRRRRIAIYAVCTGPLSRARHEDKVREHDLRGWYHPCDGLGEAAPFSPYELVYSVNCLHEWADPEAALMRCYALVAEGGHLVINDLRRDADPYITEYVIREMAEDRSEEGQRQLQLFLRSLRSAYSIAEVEEMLSRLGLPCTELDRQEAMTLTVRVRKVR